MDSAAYTISESGEVVLPPLPEGVYECELTKAWPDVECDLEGEYECSLLSGDEIHLCDWHRLALSEEGALREE